MTKLIHVECPGEFVGYITLYQVHPVRDILGLVMEKMRCSIKINRYKDQTLTVMVTGTGKAIPPTDTFEGDSILGRSCQNATMIGVKEEIVKRVYTRGFSWSTGEKQQGHPSWPHGRD